VLSAEPDCIAAANNRATCLLCAAQAALAAYSMPHAAYNVQHTTCSNAAYNMQQCNMQHTICSIQHAAMQRCGMPHTTCNIPYHIHYAGHATYSMQQCSIRHATCSIRHAACNIPYNMRHTTCDMQHTTCKTAAYDMQPCSIQHAAMKHTIQHATYSMELQHARCNIQHAACNRQHAIARRVLFALRTRFLRPLRPYCCDLFKQVAQDPVLPTHPAGTSGSSVRRSRRWKASSGRTRSTTCGRLSSSTYARSTTSRPPTPLSENWYERRVMRSEVSAIRPSQRCLGGCASGWHEQWPRLGAASGRSVSAGHQAARRAVCDGRLRPECTEIVVVEY
jgi:hypothetical protein